MCLNLHNYQSNASITKVTTNQNHTTVTKTKRKQLKRKTKENHQKTKRRNEQARITKSCGKQGFKMAINIYLSIISLNIDRLNAPIKRTEWQLKKKKLQYVVNKRLTLGQKRYTD